MRRRTFGSTGRRGTAIVASAAALCLGGALTACTGGPDGREGYAAVGAPADDGKRPSDGSAVPSGAVTLTPLDGAGGAGRETERSPRTDSASSPDAAARTTRNRSADSDGDGSGVGEGAGERTRAPGGPGGGSPGRPGAKPPADGPGASPSGRPGGPPGPGAPGPGDGSGGEPPGPGTPPPPAPQPPATPAALKLSAPQRAAAEKRWCEKVTVEFRNTGGSPARSGTVTFATHVIGALGVDWATIRTDQPLPAPIGAGAVRARTYTVCVESWRVPLGMRVETRDVSAVWS
ncbi:hypothetical protein [Streptomyces sp. NPDC101181]|uniref:hypothetical protein n=1 Tax=Streptomyces sp. NPDC101181 TaxID=3366125 RepID=UPI003816D35D